MAALLPAAAAAPARGGRAPRLLLHSSWQTVNIGDIGHTPGVLSILGRFFPEAELTLWPRRLSPESRAMLEKGYPKLTIVEGALTREGQPDNDSLARAWRETDLYISGSGSGFPDSAAAGAFHRLTGKPYGVFGVSTDPVSGLGPGLEAEGGTLAELRAKAARLPASHLAPGLRAIVDGAAFFFCRDTISRDYLRAQGVRTPVLEFGPDGQLGMHLREEAKGLAYLREAGLEPGRFLCVVPRLRYTPYYRINNVPRVPADDIRDAINARTTERDHAKLRDLIAVYVRRTGHKVLACAEMTYQVAMAKEVLVDPLPEDVKKNVVWRDRFWLPDEAASIYARALAVVSVECHSPLIAYRAGTPAFYLRQPTDTCKGQMYRDFGAGDWLFEVDEASGDALWARLEPVVREPRRARAQVKRIMAAVETRQRRMAEAARAVAAAATLNPSAAL